MQRYKKIAAISFLSIFSMYLLHQVMPHVHHDHETAEHITVSQSEHSHDGDHHHHDEDANEDFDLLGFLFGTHAHSVQADNILVAKSITKQQSTMKIVAVAATVQTGRLSNKVRDQEEQIFWQDPPDPTKTPYLSSGSLRGPPSLG
ncbi:hypothetical protein [Ekhidna sp.]|uniref:hypothetical protein n=1 Tax=Ekhidna sp. TaxID=2608089 RepID=UPI0032995361